MLVLKVALVIFFAPIIFAIIYYTLSVLLGSIFLIGKSGSHLLGLIFILLILTFPFWIFAQIFLSVGKHPLWSVPTIGIITSSYYFLTGKSPFSNDLSTAKAPSKAEELGPK